METTLTRWLPPGWFLRSEYRYAEYGTSALPDACSSGCLSEFLPGTISFYPVVQTISAQLIYRFNWSAPLADPNATVAALAAPILYKARPSPVPVDNWTGFYLEGGGGYGAWHADTTTISPTTGACILCATQTQGGEGGFGTVGGGYDYQFGAQIGALHPQFVSGIFADADFSSLSGTIQDQLPFFGGTITQNWSWAAGARVGVLATPQVLTYVNGGYTQAHFSSADMVLTQSALVTGFAPGTPSGFSTPATTIGGWFFGGGAETGLASILAPGWFLRSEYRYAFYGTANLPDTCAGVSGGAACVFTPSPQATITFHPTVQTISVSVVYKFNWLPGR